MNARVALHLYEPSLLLIYPNLFRNSNAKVINAVVKLLERPIMTNKTSKWKRSVFTRVVIY